MKNRINYMAALTIILLIIVSLAGVLSINFSSSYEAINQYGELIKMYGYGIYAHDSYFKAPILIGTDFSILLAVVPLFIMTFVQNIRKPTYHTKLRLLSIFTVALYYSASIAFGVTYNQFHLLYIALFSCSLFGVFVVYKTIDSSVLEYQYSKGIAAFLVLSGIALIIAWMPDIIPSLIAGKPLALIEVYTTEITYVLDIGIIGPLCLITLHLLKRKDKLGVVLLAVILKLCIIVGIMMIPQTICQLLSGFEMPLPALMAKSGSFVLLAIFALYFNNRLYRSNNR